MSDFLTKEERYRLSEDDAKRLERQRMKKHALKKQGKQVHKFTWSYSLQCPECGLILKPKFKSSKDGIFAAECGRYHAWDIDVSDGIKRVRLQRRSSE